MAQKSKSSPIGIRPGTKPRLLRVCKYRGWSQAEAIERMVQRELATIDAEKTASYRAAETPEPVE